MQSVFLLLWGHCRALPLAEAMAEEDGREKMKRREQGGLRTMPFILANEACDKFAAFGFSANMITYLTQELHMPLVQASNTLTNFSGTSSLTPIVGALIADSFAGRFWTIAVASVLYQLGMLSLTISAVLPGLRPPPCAPRGEGACERASTLQVLVFYGSLLLTSMGSGGIRPCVAAFGADQFNFRGPRTAVRRWHFFNLYFVVMEMAQLLALTVVVYIQDNVGWGWGMGIPTMAMFFSVVAFVGGYPLYVKMKPGGSPLTRLAQVIVAAFRKRGVALPADPGLLYEDKELDADISIDGKLLHTKQLVFFDRAAIVTDGDQLPDSGKPRPWRLSTVHRVEELKCIIRMLPVWSVAILAVMAASHNGSFAIQQAKMMDRRFSRRFQIPSASMSVFSALSMLISLALYDRVFVPLARRLTGRPTGITYFQRIGIGLAVGISANAAAALVETKRKGVAAAHGLLDDPRAVVPLSVFWLVPQYAISGLSQAFTSVGHMEFLYDQAPESMRSTATALFWLAISIGSYMGTLLVTVVHGYSRRGVDWLQDNLNRGRLEYYYWLVAGLQVLNLGYYVACAKLYTYKPLEAAAPEGCSEVTDEEDGGGDVKLVEVHDEKNGEKRTSFIHK